MIKFVYQNKPLGTGDAVLKTKKFIKSKFFLLILPDDLIVKKNCSKSMIKIHKKYKSSVMASMSVNKKNVSRWGIYKFNRILPNNNFLINDVIEKPSIKSAPSNKAVIGRYILPKSIFKNLSKQQKGKGGEIHITDAIQFLIKKKIFLLVIISLENIWIVEQWMAILNHLWKYQRYENMYDWNRLCGISKWCLFFRLR